MPYHNTKSKTPPRFVISLLVAVLCWNASLSGQDKHPKPISIQPEAQTAEWAQSWWMPRHEEKLKEKASLKNCQLVWIGDSITHGWESEGRAIWDKYFAQYEPLNLGYSGDRTENVLWRLEHGEVDGLAPKLVVIMIGTNNAGHRAEAPKDTATGIETIVKDLRKRLPEAKILLLGVFPRGENLEDPMRKLNTGTNEIIAKADDGKHVFFLDIGAKFLDSEGRLPKEVMPDLLHPNSRGYEIWADSIRDKLTSLIGS